MYIKYKFEDKDIKLIYFVNKYKKKFGFKQQILKQCYMKYDFL